MGYLTLAKYGIVVIAVLSWTYGAYSFGVSIERSAWTISTQRKAIETANKIQELTRQSMVEQLKSAELANKLEVTNHENKLKLEAIRDDLVIASKRLQQRQVCGRRDSSTTTKDSNPGSVIAEAANTTELSAEFESFLISDAYRADSVGLYAETAYTWVQQLCKDKERFICE